jgi:hypothetical protein
MKTICPFCQKELSRIEKLKYHLEKSVCSSDIEEKEEIISWLNMNISTMLEKVLNFMRKHKEILSENLKMKEQINVMTEENSLLKRNNDALINFKEKVNDTKDDTSKHIVNTTSNTIATIYRKHLLNKKIQWDNRFTKDEALSELIQNGENILSSYDKPLTLLQRDVLNVVTKIVEEETNWNCLTEKLSESLHELFQTLEFPPKQESTIKVKQGITKNKNN